MTRARIISAALAAIAACSFGSAAPAVAAPATINDLDGDGRVDIVALDASNEYIPDPEGFLPRVLIHYGSGTDEKFSAAELGRCNGKFFAQVAPVVANLNGDAYADLVLACEDSIVVMYGSAGGLDHASAIELSTPRIASLAVVPKPTPLIVAGRPGATVAGHPAAGVVTVFPVNSAGKPGSAVDISQDSPGIPGSAEAGDNFGQSVAADDSTLVIGTYLETIGSVKRTGMVSILHRTGTTSFSGPGFSQNSPGVANSNTEGDGFGSTVSIEDGYVAVSAPYKKLNRLYGVGFVQLFRYRRPPSPQRAVSIRTARAFRVRMRRAMSSAQLSPSPACVPGNAVWPSRHRARTAISVA